MYATPMPVQMDPCLGRPEDKTQSKVAVVVTFIIMIALNGISASGLIGKDIGTISDEYPTYITPDGRTFAVWSIIYIGLFALTVTQCCASNLEIEILLARRCPITNWDVRQRIVIMFLLNAVWLPIYINYRFAAALLVIVMYLGMLISIFMDLNPTTTSGLMQYLVFSAPIAANASWLVVASSANFLTVAGLVGFKDQNGVAGSPGAAQFIVLLATVIAIMVAIWPSDPMWPAVAAWALMGVYRMQTVVDEESFPVEAMNSQLAMIAQVSSFVCMGVVLVAIFLMMQRSSQQGPQMQRAAFIE